MILLKTKLPFRRRQIFRNGIRQHSKNFDATGVRVMPLKSSAVTLYLWPLNLGIGIIIPLPKSEGTSPREMKMLKIDLSMTKREGCAYLKCSITMLSKPGAVLAFIWLIATSTPTVEIMTF